MQNASQMVKHAICFFDQVCLQLQKYAEEVKSHPTGGPWWFPLGRHPRQAKQAARQPGAGHQRPRQDSTNLVNYCGVIFWPAPAAKIPFQALAFCKLGITRGARRTSDPRVLLQGMAGGKPRNWGQSAPATAQPKPGAFPKRVYARQATWSRWGSKSSN